MNSNYFRFKGLGLAGLGMVSAFTTGCNSKAEKEQESVSPNIIVILTDDQGYADLGCYGAKGFETPNLDSLASQGIRFTDFYVAATNSSPSRAALLTGCYPARVGMPSVLAPEGPEWAGERAKTGLNPKEIIIPEILNQKGYKTACFGKWHLGHHKKHLPVNQGFDEYFGLPYSNDMWPQNKSCYPPLPLIEGDSVIDTISGEEQANLTTWYTEKSIDFIERNKDGRFFLYLAHSMPHVPRYVSDKFKGK